MDHLPRPADEKGAQEAHLHTVLQLYRSVLTPGGTIHLKTDSPFLYTYTREMALANSLPLLEDTKNLYETHAGNPILAIHTHYEQQWLDRGLTIKYIALMLPQEGELAEPQVEIEHDTYRSYSRGEIQCPWLCDPVVTPKSPNP